VAVWFRAADLVALPYISATQSGVIPVAYRCQRPVIATRVGGLPDVVQVGASGYLVEPGDPLGLADTIRMHFVERGNPDMTEGVEQVCSGLSWEAYGSRLEEFIRQLLEVKRRG
jgi:glycosyltransferase involved in cell wall biosynthesis